MTTGRCTNIMRCSKAKNKEIQEADKANFVCAECGKPLMEVNEGPTEKKDDGKKSGPQGRPGQIKVDQPKGKLYALIAAAVAVVAGVILLCLNMCSDEKTDGGGNPGPDTTEIAEPVKETTVSIVQPTSTTLKVGENLTLNAKVTPEGSTVSWTSSDENVAFVSPEGKVTALKAGNADIIAQNGEVKDTVKIEVKKEETKETEKTKGGSDDKPRTGNGTINLGYGKYTGALKNGKPEGQGRIVYTQSHRIAKYDPKERVAMPGESVSGVFHNGEITIGKYFDANGKLIESLNIGSVD